MKQINSIPILMHSFSKEEISSVLIEKLQLEGFETDRIQIGNSEKKEGEWSELAVLATIIAAEIALIGVLVKCLISLHERKISSIENEKDRRHELAMTYLKVRLENESIEIPISASEEEINGLIQTYDSITNIKYIQFRKRITDT